MAGNGLEMSREICIMRERDNCIRDIYNDNYKNKSHKIIVYLKIEDDDEDAQEEAENDYYNDNLKQSSYNQYDISKSIKVNQEDMINMEKNSKIIDCDSLHSNDEIIKERLKFVGEQLVQFIKLEPININSIKQNQNNINNNQNHHLKLKTIWSVYLKLLRAGPLDLYWNYKRDFTALNNDNNHINKVDNKIKIIETRQQVLNFIENLNGYCDSINKLRLILKSPTMIAVLETYEDIVIEIEKQRLENAKLYNLLFSKIKLVSLKEHSV